MGKAADKFKESDFVSLFKGKFKPISSYYMPAII